MPRCAALAVTAVAGACAGAPAPASAPSTAPILANRMQAGPREVAPGCFEIGREELDAATSDWRTLARSIDVRWLEGGKIPGLPKGEAWPGVEISALRPDAFAARVGLRVGDVIFAFDGHAMSLFQVFASLLADPEAAAEVMADRPRDRLAELATSTMTGAASLAVIRGGSVITINVVLAGTSPSACDARIPLRELEAEQWLAFARCAAGAPCDQLTHNDDAYEARQAEREAADRAPYEREFAAAGVATEEEADAIVSSITRIDPAIVELPNTLTSTQLLRVLARRTARVVPGVSGGRPAGVKLYAIRPNSVYAVLGFQNGDMVQRIDGQSVLTPVLLEVQLARSAEHATTTIELLRRGKPETISYRRVAASPTR